MLEYVWTKFLTDKILHTKTLPYLSGKNNFVNDIYVTAEISTICLSNIKAAKLITNSLRNLTNMNDFVQMLSHF